MNEDMFAIPHQFQTHFPKDSGGKIDPKLFCGDQLTVECPVNAVAATANGFTTEDHLEGMNFQIRDRHAEVKTLSVSYQYLLTTLVPTTSKNHH